MTTNTVTRVVPANLNRIDQSADGQFIASVVWMLAAQMGRITEPVETITERDMVNPDYFSPEDFEAWEEDMAEAAATERAIWNYQDRMEDLARDLDMME